MLIAGSATAAELPLKAPAALPPVCTWCGWYIGVNGGGVWGTTDSTLDTQNTLGGLFSAADILVLNAAGANSFNNNGWLAGGQVGYLYEDLGSHFVLAFELAIDAVQLKGSVSNPGLLASTHLPLTITEGMSNQTTWLGTFLIRAGYDFGGGGGGYFGGFIPYWTIGPAITQVRHNFNFVDTTVFSNTADFGQVVAGAAVGGGIELRLVDHWSIRGEYLYVDFGGTNGSARLVNAPAGDVVTFYRSERIKENIARGFLSYKF